jgi:uracil-DNA glycosylase
MNFPDALPPGWRQRLSSESEAPYFRELTRFLRDEYASGHKIYPSDDCVFRALQEVDFASVRVVLLGQDPYHGEGQAIGLSFGVPNSLRPKPPSLKNILKELESDLGCALPLEASDLTGWARQGVLLLNTVLTVRQGQAFSHRDRGWERFTDRVINLLNERQEPVVFILWGSAAQKKKEHITGAHHALICAAHPSPLSAYRGFFGSKPFSKVNAILTNRFGQAPIHWAQVTR